MVCPSGVFINEGNNAFVNKLIGDNYNYWKICIEANPQGQDLSDLISGDDALPTDTPQNVEALRKWKIKYDKALFALRTSVNKEYIEHVRDVTLPKEVWETLERLFMNATRLQYFLRTNLLG